MESHIVDTVENGKTMKAHVKVEIKNLLFQYSTKNKYKIRGPTRYKKLNKKFGYLFFEEEKKTLIVKKKQGREIVQF